MLYEILAVEKPVLGAMWFHVFTTCGRKLTVYDSGISWRVEKSTAKLSVISKDGDEQVTSCVIWGSKKELQNMMFATGMDVPSKVSEHFMLKTVDDLQTQVRSLVYQLEELIEKLKS
jgi:hypothetical protein